MSDDSRQSFFNRIRVQKDLEKATGNEISRHGRGAELVAKFAALDRGDQDFIYNWADIISESNEELSGQFINWAPFAFDRMDRAGVESWLMQAMDEFDNRGLGAGIESLEKLPQFAESYSRRHSTCDFDQVAQFLQHSRRTGLGGRELTIDCRITQETFTDTEKLFLPETISVHDLLEENFSLYKLTAVHLWAQSWFGTWRYQVVERLMRAPDVEQVVGIFNRARVHPPRCVHSA